MVLLLSRFIMDQHLNTSEYIRQPKRKVIGSGFLDILLY